MRGRSRVTGAERWFENAAVYSLSVEHCSDGDGDGVGDLAGLRSRLDHLEWLGIDAVWLNPIMPSPDEDWGYDVSDSSACRRPAASGRSGAVPSASPSTSATTPPRST